MLLGTLLLNKSNCVPAGRHAARRLLQLDLLVVPVNRALAVDREGAVALAHGTHAHVNVRTVVLEQRPDGVPAPALQIDHLELGKHGRPKIDVRRRYPTSW